MNTIFQQIRETGIVPVVVLNRAEDALPLAQALCEGGLPCAEVTFRTAAAEESIRIMTTAFPDMLVGAGTVLTAEQAQKAADSGARFVVSPGLNPVVVQYCIDHDIPIIPGCCTPSDVERALSFGLNIVKFFPAEQAGGLGMIKALAAPYTDVAFMPTGGLNPQNIKSYLAYDRILACGGSWMVKRELIESGKFDQIKLLTETAVELVKESRGTK